MTPPSATATEVAATVIPEPAAAPSDALLLHHSYDGIQEYDNPLPGWWTAIFWASVVFSAGYGAYYHLAGWGELPAESYRAALVEYEGKRVLRDRADAANASEGSLTRRIADPKIVDAGRAVFLARCASCHTEDGRGLIGPNLTDHFQLHGETRMDIYNVVRKGVPGTAMLAWSEQLPVNDVLAVTAYVATLRGQNVPNGKPREGRKVAPFAP
ncbi:MAG: c-type cytochrome [Myxococcota bacterium]|nr:c-type cytochrome [Myxococcota bacterium]